MHREKLALFYAYFPSRMGFSGPSASLPPGRELSPGKKIVGAPP